MKRICLVGTIAIFFACSNSSSGDEHEFINLQIGAIYKTGGGFGYENRHVEMAHHYLILKEFDEKDNYGWNQFIAFADSYRDTVQMDLPLSAITICKPFNTNRNFSGGDGWQEMRENSLLTVAYSHQTMHEKLAHISGLTIWRDGKPYSINVLTPERMKKLGGYYDSSGEYSFKWMDRYKNQIPPDADTL